MWTAPRTVGKLEPHAEACSKASERLRIPGQFTGSHEGFGLACLLGI